MTSVCALVVTGAPLAQRCVDIAAAIARTGWHLTVVATPAGVGWVDATELTKRVPGASLRSEFRPAGVSRTIARPDVVVVCPMTFNAAAKMALGIADNYAMSLVAEAIAAGRRVVTVPMINDQLWKHPALDGHLAALRAFGVSFVDVNSGSDDAVPVQSGTGDHVSEMFDPAWVTRFLSAIG